MLNPFPELLTYSFFAPTLLRVTAAVVLGYTAYRLLANRTAAINADLPVLGKPPVAFVWIASTVTALAAAALLFGYGTQIAALIGAAVALKHARLPKRLAYLSPLSRGTYLLLFVICLSLIISGAGAFAMDLRL